VQQSLDTDSLLRALLAKRDESGWINHTYEHRDLDAASRGTIEADIAGNRRWADQVGERLRAGALDHVGHLGLSDALSWPRLLELEAVRIFATASRGVRPGTAGDNRHLRSRTRSTSPDRYRLGLRLHREQGRVDPRATR
jgi:hypothetical protein